MSDDEFELLARYNAEVARGINHTAEWRARMAQAQALFDSQGRTARQGRWDNVPRFFKSALFPLVLIVIAVFIASQLVPR